MTAKVFAELAAAIFVPVAQAQSCGDLAGAQTV